MLTDDFSKSMKKFKKRYTLATNRSHGKLSENISIISSNVAGYETKTTGRGHDYARRKVNHFTGQKGKWEFVEHKSSATAPQTKLQKKTQKQYKKQGKKYVLERPLF